MEGLRFGFSSYKVTKWFYTRVNPPDFPVELESGIQKYPKTGSKTMTPWLKHKTQMIRGTGIFTYMNGLNVW